MKKVFTTISINGGAIRKALLALVFFFYWSTHAQGQCTSNIGVSHNNACSGDVIFTAISTGVSSGASSVSHIWYTSQTGSEWVGYTTATNLTTGVWRSTLTRNLSSAVTYYVATAISGCGESSTRYPVSWAPTPPGSITINASPSSVICAGTSVTLTPSGCSSCTWSHNGASGAITVSPTVNTTYSISGTTSTCGNYTSSSITILVSPQVGTPGISGPSNICLSTTTNSTYTANATNASQYGWAMSPAAAGSINQTTGAVTWNQSYTGGTATITVTAYPQMSNAPCPQTNSMPVSITPVTGVPTPTPATITAKYGDQVTLTASGALNGASYRWYLQGSSIGMPVNTGSLTNQSSAFTISTYIGSCELPSGQRPTQTINIYIDPPPAPTVSSNTCGPRTITLPAPPNGITYYWQGTTQNGRSTSTPLGANTPFTLPGSGTYYINAKITAAMSPAVWSADRSFSATVINPSPPSVPSVSSNTCGAKTLTRGTPSDGSTWYWQGTNASGTSMSSSASTYTASTTGTYYIRAYLSGCWSAATSVPVTVINPVVPSVPTVSTNSCGPKTLTRGNATDGSTWYWQGTNANGTNQSSSASTYTANTSGTYYIRAYLSGCWSASASVPVSVTNPAAPAVPTVSSNTCGAKTLTRGTPSDGSTWYWQGTNASGTDMSSSASTYPASTAGTYYIRAYLSGCWSAATAVPVTVNNPAPPVIASLTASTCGPRTLTKGSPPAGVTYYWQGTTANGQDSSSPVATASTYTITSTGIYILGARDASGCWAYNPIEVHIDAVDIVVNTYHPVNSVVEATNSITLGPNFTVPAGSSFNARITISSACNDVVNWTETIVYNDAATPIGASKSYFDGLGKSLISQSKDFLNNKVFASQPIYNAFGVPAASTMAAPILERDFIFKNNFVRNESNAIYSASDFDLRTTTNVANSGEVNQPKPVGEQPGTLGWYYSANNNLEPNTPVTNYPYSRGYALEGPDPTISKSAGPGDSHRMGAGHEVTTERQLIATGDLTHYLSLRSYFVTSSLPVTGYKHITTDPDGKKVVSFTDGDGRSLASAILNGSTFENWSYAYYNDLGQLVASVAPNGVNTSSSASPQFVTRYYYDHLGRLIETSSPDEGVSRFVYNTDGQIRFSQNQVQFNANPKRFSYTNYDYLGRLIESGEYTSSSGGYIFEPHTTTTPASNSVLNLVDQVGQTSGVTRKLGAQMGYISDYTYIEYDRQAIDFPYTSPVIQENVDGQVAKTENENATTWYSYDEFGRVSKTWQRLKLTNPVVEKSIEYTYDYFGNVTEVAYQKNNSSDRFYHHYTYDLNQRLTEVHTSKDGTTKKLQAKYQYYLHGPLKRVVLADNLQGIDYTYTIDGSLKTINHADPAKDPGGDGNDIFGETLQYFDNDYQGAGYSAGNQTVSGYNNQYSGLLKASSWHSPVDNQVKRTYAYQYDSRNQLTNAIWGDMTGAAGSYSFFPANLERHREGVGSYDKNGNIQSLIRKGKDGNTLGNYAYIYEANTNKVDKINHNAAQLVDYTYNAIGQMTKQDEGTSKTFNVAYNAYGLVREVRDYNNLLLQTYFYDDRGDLLQKVTYVAGAPQKYTTYVSDVSGNTIAVYEHTYTSLSAQPAEVPVYGSGRIALHKPAINTYFYEMNDHLGNVRAVIGLTDTDNSIATMESEVNEDPPFKGIPARRVSFAPPGTAAGNEMVRMNSSAPAGPGTVLKVSPGDVVTLQADAYYEAGVIRDYFVSSSSLVTAIAGVFGGVSGGVGEAGKIYSGINGGFGSLFAGGGGGSPPDPEDDENPPYAYLTYMFLDVNMNFQYGGFKSVSSAANLAIEHLALPSLNIQEPGFVYVFLYNRSQSTNWVYFDNLSVTHVHSPIVAGGDYYPYGLVMENREITDEPYRYGYQGQFSEKDQTTSMQEFELRMYDPRIGRWLSPDPYGQFASPYLAMANNPIMNVDPDGGFTGGPGPMGSVWDAALQAWVLPVVEVTFNSSASIAAAGVARLAVAKTYDKKYTYSLDAKLVRGPEPHYELLKPGDGSYRDCAGFFLQVMKESDPNLYDKLITKDKHGRESGNMETIYDGITKNLNGSLRNDDPKVGDVAVWRKWDDVQKRWRGHVEFVESVTEKDGKTFFTIYGAGGSKAVPRLEGAKNGVKWLHTTHPALNTSWNGKWQGFWTPGL